ncbi:ATP-binding protein [Caldicellulosiruptor sp. F32]|uniref:ATP-binding protein n=1 Tax=Caldicellulosiruptor sp. F32 TaxID=1214564 RepID=UPI003FA40F35
MGLPEAGKINQDNDKREIITTNKVFDKWLRIFYAPLVAMSLLNRLVYYCNIVVIKSRNYRMN